MSVRGPKSTILEALAATVAEIDCDAAGVRFFVSLRKS